MSDEQQGPPAEPSAEEIAMALVERLGATPVRDITLQTMATFVDVAGVRLGLGPQGDDVRDLAQARQAIEILRALLGVAEHEIGAAQVRPFREPLAQLQLAYARMSEGGEGGGEDAGPPAGEAPGGGGPQTQPGGPPPGPDPASRLWVPPGSRRPGA
jgi:hypothetical protein